MLNQVLNVKVKYENIIRRLLDNEQTAELTQLAIQDASAATSDSVGLAVQSRPLSALTPSSHQTKKQSLQQPSELPTANSHFQQTSVNFSHIHHSSQNRTDTFQLQALHTLAKTQNTEEVREPSLIHHHQAF